MQMTRNRYFLIGILLILLGIQFRMVESFVLNAPTTRALAKMTKNTPVADNNFMSTVLLQVYPTPTKRVSPPRWLGLAMIAIGAVVVLHAISMPKNQGH
jgi:LPS O-antigen subunit length determinant protein (WzzB/FepE family)